MNSISENIKYLRKQAGLTQEQFAEALGIKRSLVGAYEEGRADPRLNNLVNIASYFNLEIDDLVRKDLAGGEKIAPRQSLKVLAITVDSADEENIEFVQEKASAGYSNGYSDPDYIKELPKFRLPFLPGSGTYRAFEINGDSMLPMPSGTIIIGQYVEHPDQIINGKTYVILTRQDGIVYKRVFNYIEDRKSLYLVSDNHIYPPYEVSAEDILEVWEARSYIGSQFPFQRNSEDLSLEELKNMVLELQQEVVKLRDR